MGGDEEQQEDQIPSNLVGGGEMRLDWMISQMTKERDWRKMQEETLGKY